ncbi:MAG: cytochrome c biogenesis protein CcdA [Spirochaetaceae bacterium]|jgi:cytochrome c-type biogenesis protein|nr:cytochrome c biogenesis protein CcdA [Spirochaetaceae bacterium]
MANDISLLAAFAAGILSFLSPCVLPLISSYFLLLSGTPAGASQEEGSVASSRRPAILGKTACFVLGFTLVFMALSILFSGLFFMFSGAGAVINRIAGIIVVLLGLNMLLDFIPFLNYEKRIHLSTRLQGYTGSLLAGAAFGAGWTPCVGPILGSILLMAGQSGTLFAGAGYLLVYSLGLGLPFLACAFFLGSFLACLEKLKPWRRLIHKASGIFIIAVGVFIMLGRFQNLSGFFMKTGYGLSLWSAQREAPFITAGFLLFIALLPIGYRLARGRKPFSRTSLVVCALFAALSAAQAAGAIDCAAFLSRWLLFTGPLQRF